MSIGNQIGVLKRLNPESLLDGKIPDLIPLKQGRYIVGRGSHADYLLSAQKDGKFIISRQHAALISDGGKCSIEDVGALNGIFVNGVRLKSKVLADGDIVQFGGMSDALVGCQYDADSTDVAVRYKCELFQHNNKASTPKDSVKELKKSGEKLTTNTIQPPTASKKRARNAPLESDSEVELAMQGKAQPVEPKAMTMTVVKPEPDTEQNDEELSPQKKKKVRMSSNGSISELNLIIQPLPSSSSSSSSAALVTVDAPASSSTPKTSSSPNPTIVSSSCSVPNGSFFEALTSFKAQHAEEMQVLQTKYQFLEHLVQKLVLSPPQPVPPPPPALAGPDPALVTLQASLEVLQQEKAALQNQCDALALAQQQQQQQQLQQVAEQATVKALRCSLTCILCKQLFVNAVVLQCSHAFCWDCLETHLTRKVSTCPLCFNPAPGDTPNPKKQSQQTSRRTVRHLNKLFFRCEALDSLVDSLLQHNPADQEAFETRATQAEKTLKALGINTMEDFEVEVINDDLSSNNNNGKKKEDQTKVLPVTCDYCGGTDHTEPDCPHTNHHDGEEDEEENEEDQNYDESDL